jgi:hypothetical protein
MNYELAADTISCDDADEMLVFAFSANESEPANSRVCTPCRVVTRPMLCRRFR